MKIMNILKLIAFFAAATLIAACEPDLGNQDGPEGVVPNFPELVENYSVEPGSTQELVFTPNLDWKLTIPSEIRQWFWIQDDSFKVTELTGSASTEPVKVSIGVTETPEFDKNFSCDVTLHMGDSAKVIAKYMLPAKEKVMQVYTAKMTADGGFEIAEDAVSYVYSDQEATNVNLIWSESDSDFRMPIKVVSNCEWTVDLPQWAEVNVPETTSGVVELVVKGESVEGATGKLTFYNGESKLAELDVTVPSCGGVEVYTAKLDGDEFEYTDEGEFVWTDKAADEITMVWMDSDFRMPVKVSAKCNWNVTMPKWLTAELPEKTAGDVSFTFKGVPSEYPLEDTQDKLVFKNGDVVVSELTVNMPGCKDIMYFSMDMSLTSLEYNYLGEVKTSTGYIAESVVGHLLGSKDVRVFSVETTDNKLGQENPSWFNVEISNWNTASGADVLQERSLTFTATENEGAVRTAVLFTLPPSITVKTSELFDDDINVKDEYAIYAVEVSQNSRYYDEYITMNIDETAEYSYTFEKADQSKKDELSSLFGNTEHVYILNYESPYSSDYATMTMAVEYDSFKIFSNDGTMEDKSDVDRYWLQYQSLGESNGAGVVDMYFNKKNISEDNPAEVMPLPSEPSVGYVVFYDSNSEVLAIVECISPYESNELKVDTSSLTFGPDASQLTFNVEADEIWSIKSDSDWCTVSPSSGMKDAEVTVSVTENTESATREAKLTVKAMSATYVITVTQTHDESAKYNGDEDVHFVNYESAKAVGATIERLKSGEIYKQYREGKAPLYHLIYTRSDAPVRIVLPENIIRHNVNPFVNRTNFKVNDTVYDEYFGPNDILSEVVLDSDNSVKISMELPEGTESLTGKINFMSKDDDTPVVVVVCTIDISAE